MPMVVWNFGFWGEFRTIGPCEHQPTDIIEFYSSSVDLYCEAGNFQIVKTQVLHTSPLLIVPSSVVINDVDQTWDCCSWNVHGAVLFLSKLKNPLVTKACVNLKSHWLFILRAAVIVSLIWVRNNVLFAALTLAPRLLWEVICSPWRMLQLSQLFSSKSSGFPDMAGRSVLPSQGCGRRHMHGGILMFEIRCYWCNSLIIECSHWTVSKCFTYDNPSHPHWCWALWWQTPDFKHSAWWHYSYLDK